MRNLYTYNDDNENELNFKILLIVELLLHLIDTHYRLHGQPTYEAATWNVLRGIPIQFKHMRNAECRNAEGGMGAYFPCGISFIARGTHEV